MENAARIAEVVIAVIAVGALIVTVWQARINAEMARIAQEAAADQHRMLQEDLKTRLLLHYEDRFESPEMLAHRRTLADRLRNFGIYQTNKPIADSQYDVIGDEVLGFFESLRTMLRRGDIDPELVWGVFDYAARHYWTALSNYVREDRRRNGEDLWDDFDGLVKAMDRYYERKHGSPAPLIDNEKVAEFLRQESQAGH